MSHHKHSRERDRERDRLLPSSTYYSKDYHSGDPHFPKRRFDEVRGGSGKHYTTSPRPYSNDRDRVYEDKKQHHGHSSGTGSFHQPYPSSSSASHHHRQSYEKHPSVSVSGGSHHQDYHPGGHGHGGGSSSSSRYKSYEGTSSHSHGGHGHGSHSVSHPGSSSSYPSVANRVLRKPVRVDYRKPYEKTSGVRRVPPPLSPPPLMKLATSVSSSRYRQAPPEDRHHQRVSNKTGERSQRSGIGSSMSLAKRNIKLVERRPRRALDTLEKPRATKRSSEAVHENDKKPTKKIKDEKQNGDVVEKTPIAPDTNDGKNDSKTENEQTEATNSTNDGSKTEKKPRRRHTGDEEGDSRSKRPLLKLTCTYCDFRCVSFKDFSIHTRSLPHGRVMSTLIDDYRAKVISLKHSVRDEQKELEKSMDEQKTLSDTTSYCRVCEIDLRSDPKEHEANEIHNEIKGMVDRKCELCNVDFRHWKVYLFHTVALEHVKRAALKEMKDKAGQEDSVAGSNMTKDDLGLNLLEQKNVIFCKACVRYFPIREDNYDESCMKHCMALNHIKFVEDYTARLKYIAKRDAEEKARAEAKRLARKAKEAEKAEAAAKTEAAKSDDARADSEQMDNETDGIELKIEHTEDELDDFDTSKEDGKEKDIDMDDGEGDVSQSQFNHTEDSQDEHEVEEEEEAAEEQEPEHENEPEPEDEEPDEDEIQLHADEDDEVDAPPREDE